MLRQNLRVFISSPGNLGPERQRAREVVNRIAQQYEKVIRLEGYFWEEYSARGDDNFVNQIPESKTYDAVVCIFWDTVGETPIPLDVRRRPDSDSPYESGTIYEFETAREEARRTGGRPALFVFRKTSPLIWPNEKAKVAEKKASFDRLEAFWSRWIQHEDRSFNSAFMPFVELDEFDRELRKALTDDWLGRLLGIGRDAIYWDVRRDGSPFPGLVPFGAAYRRVFRGRDAAIERVVGWLRDASVRGAPTFFLIRGASGSGKSSLVRAGVQPLLAGNSAGESWSTATMLPGAAPLARLAAAICEALPSPFHGGAVALEEILRTAPHAASRQIAAILQSSADERRVAEKRESAVHGRLFLLVDQLEEAVASPDADNAAELGAFADAVKKLCESGAVWAVATLRNDLESVLLESPLKPLADPGDWGAGSMPLAPPDAVADIIEGPAAIAGLTLETRGTVSLADEIHDDLAGQTDALPLLQMTLAQLFEQDIVLASDKRTLTLKSYQDMGRLQGAIASKAGKVVEILPPEQQGELDRLLRMLVKGRSPGGLIVSSTLKLPDRTRDPQLFALIESLAGPDARLLVIEKDTVRVAHEALLRAWPRAQNIALDEAKFKDLCRQLREAVELQETIAPGKLLATADDYLDRLRSEGGLDREVALVVKSLGKRDSDLAEERRRRRWFQGLSAVMCICALAACVGFLWAWTERDRATSGFLAAKRLGTDLTAWPERELRERAGISPGWREQWINPEKAGMDGETNAGLSEPGVSLLIARVNLMRAEAFRIAGDMAAAVGYVDNAERRIGQAAPHQPAERDWKAARRDVLLIKSELALTRNDVSGARAALEGGMELAAGLFADDPKAIENLRALARAYRDRGNVLVDQEPPDAAAAEAAYQKAIDLLYPVAGKPGADVLLQTDYIEARERMADVLMDTDLLRALEIYRDDLNIADELAIPPPAWLQTSLSLAREKLADALLETSPPDYDKALELLRLDVAMRQALHEQDPANRKLFRNLAVEYYHLGYTLKRKGDLTEARNDFTKATDIFELLRAGSTVGIRSTSDVASGHLEIGSVQALDHRCTEARKEFRLAADVLPAVVSGQPDRFSDIRDELRLRQSELEAQCEKAAP